MSKWDYWERKEEKIIGELQLLDGDWSRHSVWVGAHLGLRVEGSLILNEMTGDVTGLSIDSMAEW